MNTISKQPLSIEGGKPTPPRGSKTKKIFLTLPSRRAQSKQLSNRDKNVQNTDATEETSPNINKIEEILNDVGEIIGFLIEHDKASKDGETSPDKLLNNLLNECRGSKDGEMQEAVKKFDETVGNTAEKAKGKIKIQKAFVVPSQCPPSTSTRNLLQVKVRESVDKKVNDEIRQPLFNAVKPLVSLKLEQTKAKIIEDAKDAANRSTFSQMAVGRAALRTEQMKCIALLSSIDREGTINLLQSDDGCMLLPTYLRNPNASPEVNYGHFLKDLYTLAHPKVDENGQKEQNKQLLEKYGGNETEPLLKALYSNLALGRPLYRDGAREVLSAENSPYRLGKMELLKTLAEEVGKAYWLFNDENEISPKSNLKLFDERDLENLGLDEFKFVENLDLDYPERSYISKSKKTGELLHISLREVKEISLAEAKMLGLVTPENAKKLEKQGIRTITPMFIVPRWEASSEDTKFTAIPNIMGMTPEALKHAEKFTGEVCKKIEEENGARTSPYVPVCAGFCMGAMTAQAIGTKYNIPSLVFNPFNPDPGVLEEFAEADADALKQANDPEHALCHQAYRMMGDYISDPEFLDSQVRADASKALTDPKMKMIKEELAEASSYIKQLLTFEPQETVDDFGNRLKSLSEEINTHLKEAFDKTGSLSKGLLAALKHKAENFFANKPAMVGQSYLLDTPLDIFEKPTDDNRHIYFPNAIAEQPNYGGKGVIEEDLAERMINVIKKADSIKQQVISSIGENEVNRLGEDKAIEQWVENSLMDYDHENGINIDTDGSVKLEIMKAIIEKAVPEIIEKDQDLKEQITTLIGKKTITNLGEDKAIKQWIGSHVKYEDAYQIVRASDNSIKLEILNILDQNLRSIMNGVEEAINKDPNVREWVTENIENSDISHWVNNNISNTYKNKDWATTSFKKDIQEWVVQKIFQNKVTQVIEKNKNLKKQVTTLIGEDVITNLGEDEAIKKWIGKHVKYDDIDQTIKASNDDIKQKITDELNQNWASIVNGVKEAINERQDVKDWVTKNIKNGNIEQWIKDNIDNSYESEDWATKSSKKDIQEWVVQEIFQNRVTQVIEKNKSLKKQVTTLIGEGKTIEQWIEENDNLEDRLKIDIHDDNAVKQKITDMLNQNWASIVNGVEKAMDDWSQNVKEWVAKNIENGDIEQWLKDNIPNTYENEERAKKSSKNIRTWITRTMVQNKVTQVIEKNKNLKKQITTLIGKDKTIEQWIGDNFVYENLTDRLKVDIHDDNAIKQKILGIIDPFRLQL